MLIFSTTCFKIGFVNFKSCCDGAGMYSSTVNSSNSSGVDAKECQKLEKVGEVIE